MRITLTSKSSKVVATVIGSGMFLFLALWVSKTYAAFRFAQKPTVPNLIRATKLDPSSSEYHLRLGNQFLYSLYDIDPPRALYHFRRAAELNDHSPQTWLEMGAAYELDGKLTQATTCLRVADYFAPNLPRIQWVLGNFQLLHGANDEAFRHFRVVLAGSSKYNQILFQTAWKASGEPETILNTLIPNRLPTEVDYIYYLLGQQRYPEAHRVWERVVAHSEKPPLDSSLAYVDRLILARRPGDAAEIWLDLQRKGLIRNTSGSNAGNLVFNGDFEEKPENAGFDWRLAAIGGAYAGIDTNVFHSPGHALLIQFSGKENVAYGHTYQYVKVLPKHRYLLSCSVRSEGITTDSGPRLLVRDAYDPSVLDKVSEDVTGTNLGWSSLSMDFTTSPGEELILVGVARLPSKKLDNLIAGKIWIDDVALSDVTRASTMTSR